MSIEKQENRIYKHYQVLRHRQMNKLRASIWFDPWGPSATDDSIILYLAKHWKMSCKQIKVIVRYNQKKNKENK